MNRTYQYYTTDVFTEQRFGGNPTLGTAAVLAHHYKLRLPAAALYTVERGPGD